MAMPGEIQLKWTGWRRRARLLQMMQLMRGYQVPFPWSPSANISSRTGPGVISMSWPSSPAYGRSGSLCCMQRTSLIPGLDMTCPCPKLICFFCSLGPITSWEPVSIFDLYRLIRHDLPLPKTNLLLLFTGGKHFMGAGEYLLPLRVD